MVLTLLYQFTIWQNRLQQNLIKSNLFAQCSKLKEIKQALDEGTRYSSYCNLSVTFHQIKLRLFNANFIYWQTKNQYRMSYSPNDCRPSKEYKWKLCNWWSAERDSSTR